MLARWRLISTCDIEELLADLSMEMASDELLLQTGLSHEPYRVLLRDVRSRLKLTRRQLEARIKISHSDGDGTLIEQLLSPLLLIDRSLRETGLADIADGDLKNTLRRLNCFGITLLRLDIRQESTRHRDALDAITRYLEFGRYVEWDESRRQAFLIEELQARRPLVDAAFRNADECTPEVREVLDTCQVIAEQGSEGSVPMPSWPPRLRMCWRSRCCRRSRRA